MAGSVGRKAAGVPEILAFAKSGPEAVPVIQTDFVTVAETGVLVGNVFGDNGAGPDVDPDGPLQVAAVNSLATAVGVFITLASGALLRVNADGTFDYDTNHAFDHLPGPLSGAANQSATDVFTYALAGGGSATVTVTILGEDSDGDVLEGAPGADAFDGGVGIDTIDYTAAAAGVTVGLNNGVTPDDGDGASDTLTGIENVTGSAFNDILIGADGINVLSGGLGRDYLIGLGGADVLYGGAGAANQLQGGLGDDDYYVDANDTITEFAGQGYDQVFTTRDRYALAANLEDLTYTGAGAFAGFGNSRDNILTGGDGADLLNGGRGADTLRGGAGIDMADYLGLDDSVRVSLIDGFATDDGEGAIDVLFDIENLRGSNHDDELTGNGGANLLDGAGGDDLLSGGDGNDVLRGGSGEDFMVGGAGADTIVGYDDDDFLVGGDGAANHLQGGRGDDTYFVTANDTLIEFAQEGHDRVETTRSAYTLRANFEELEFTGAGNFTGGGNDGANRLTGGAGHDTLTGGKGNDAILGRDGFDTAVLSGLQGDYTIVLQGNGTIRVTDSVSGRDGSDVLTGVEQLRFSNGAVLALAPVAAPAGDAKDASLAQVLPGLSDDDFLLAADAEWPDVLTIDVESLDAFGSGGTVALQASDHFMLTLGVDGTLIDGFHDIRHGDVEGWVI